MSITEACDSLIDAIDANRTDIIKSILDHVASLKEDPENTITKTDVLGATCCSEGTILHYAVSKGNRDAVRALLSVGADPGVKNASASTPVQLLNTTLQQADPSAFKAVKQAFTDQFFQNIASSNMEQVKNFIASGVSINEVDSELTRNSALHWAASFGSKDVVELLIRNEANINIYNTMGLTPLHDAVLRGDPHVVSVLVEAGADQGIIVSDGKHKGKTARDLASNKEKLEGLFSPKSKGGVDVAMNNHPDTISSNIVNIPDKSTNKVSNTDEMDNNSAAASIRHNNPKSVQDIVHNATGNTSESGVQSLKEGARNGASNLLGAGLQEKGATVNMSRVESKPIDRELELLWPQPAYIHQQLSEGGDEVVTLPSHLRLSVSSLSSDSSAHELLDTWELFIDELEELGFTASVQNFDLMESCDCDVRLCVQPSAAARETNKSPAYSLIINKTGVKIIGESRVGLQYGVCTLLQILMLYKKKPLPLLVVRDRPALSSRGIMLDLANYGRVPNVPTLLSLIRILARLKVNQIYLYVRLSVSNDWQLVYSPQDLLSVDRECHDYNISLIPALDIIQPCSYAELSRYTPVFKKVLSVFSCHQNLHLGPYISSVILSAAKKVGVCDVFSSLSSILAAHAVKNFLICSNSVLQDKVLVQSLPNNVSLVDYGFQSDYPFLANNRDTLSWSGNPVISCPGTAGWNCILGRPDVCLANISAAVEGLPSQGGCNGIIVAHWACSPALSHLTSALTGWLLGTGLAWNPRPGKNPLYCQEYLGELISYHALQDNTGGGGDVLLSFGRAESVVDVNLHHNTLQLQSTLFMNIVTKPLSTLEMEGLKLDQLSTVIQTLRRGLSRLQSCREGGMAAGEGMLQELTLSGELLLVSARMARGLLQTPTRSVQELQPTFKTDIANRLLALLEQYRAVWLSRYLPGGLQDTLLHLSDVLNTLLPEKQKNLTPYST